MLCAILTGISMEGESDASTPVPWTFKEEAWEDVVRLLSKNSNYTSRTNAAVLHSETREALLLCIELFPNTNEF